MNDGCYHQTDTHEWQSIGPHAHLECPFCESIIVCATYTQPPTVNGESMPIRAVPGTVDRLCEDHLAVHVEEMLECVSS